MNKTGKVLLIYPDDNPQAEIFARTLQSAISNWQIECTGRKLTTLLEIRKHHIAHYFTNLPSGAVKGARKFKGAAKLVQTILSIPDRPEGLDGLLFGDQIVVFSDHDKALLSRLGRRNPVKIPPAVALPSSLPPSAEIREKHGASDKLFALALNDVENEEQFKTFLYVAREYNRKEDFKFVIPQFVRGKNARWRDHLAHSVKHEKLASTEILTEDADMHALIDSCDVALYTRKSRDPKFDFPLNVVETLIAGKPVICHDVPPVREPIALFNPAWIARTSEDFVRISRDIAKQTQNLEQTSTELARFARATMSPENVATEYEKIYADLLRDRKS